MKKKLNILVGLLLMIMGVVGSTLKIDNPFHYFGTGVFFGIGISLIIIPLYIKSKEKIKP